MVFIDAQQGGGDGDTATKSLAVFGRDDIPVTDRFNTGPTDMGTPRRELAGGRFNGTIFAIGGQGTMSVNPGTTGKFQVNEGYDISQGSWDHGLPRAGTPRSAMASAVVEGSIHVVGGRTENNDALGFHEAFAPRVGNNGSWEPLTDMPTNRRNVPGASIGSLIYMSGGRDATGSRLATMEEYDTVTDTWTSKADMPYPRGDHSAGTHAGTVYAISGRTVGTRTGASMVAYSTGQNTWDETVADPGTRHWTSADAAQIGPRILALGDRGGDRSEEYHVVDDTWRERAKWGSRNHLAIPDEPDASIYLIGGRDGGDGADTKVERYDVGPVKLGRAFKGDIVFTHRDTVTIGNQTITGPIGSATVSADGDVEVIGSLHGPIVIDRST